MPVSLMGKACRLVSLMGKACRRVSLMGKACRLEGAQFSRLLSTRSIPYPSTDLIRDETRYQTY